MCKNDESVVDYYNIKEKHTLEKLAQSKNCKQQQLVILILKNKRVKQVNLQKSEKLFEIQ